MVRENFEIWGSQMAKIALKIFYKLQENSSSMAINYSLSSTMVGENFEIWGSQMSKTAL